MLLNMMQLLGKLGIPLLYIACIVPVILWIPSGSFANLTELLRSASQVTGLVGTVLLCLNFLLTVRAGWLESLFSGLNRMYIIHHVIGALSFVLLMVHPMFMVCSYLTISLQAAATLILPNLANYPLLSGYMSLITMIILLIITFYLMLEYDIWKKTHQWLGLALFFAAIHIATSPTTLESNLWLRVYIYTSLVIAVVSFLYTKFSTHVGVSVTWFTVEQLQQLHDATALYLKPKRHMPRFFPGQFMFLEFRHRGILKESHPFSIASAPHEPNMLFITKPVGDFTEQIRLADPGALVKVQGPYGHFSYVFHPRVKQLWVAGGIGVTPFMSMLRSLGPNHRFDIVFVYCVSTPEEGIFSADLTLLAQRIPNVHFQTWVSKVQGRLTGDILNFITKDIPEREIFICGPPPMMKSLKVQLAKHGAKPGRVHTEEFAMN